MAKKQEPGVALPGQLEGADTHFSTDKTSNPQPVANSPQSGERVEYPKYLYHREQAAKVVADPDEHAALGEGWQEKPYEQEPTPEPEQLN